MRYNLPGIQRHWLKRPNPSAAGITPPVRQWIDRNLMVTLENLTTKCAAPFQVVDSIAKLVEDKAPSIEVVQESYDFAARPLSRYLVRERHRNAFCLVHPGRKGYDVRNGVNILVSHIDVPLLRARVAPTWFEMVDDEKFSHPGPYLEMLPYGGLNAADWLGKTGHITGRNITRTGAERKVRIRSKILHTSLHLETDAEESSFDRVRAFTGVNEIEKLYKQLDVEREEDLGSAELFFWPDTPFVKLADYVSAYGLDDRSCVTAAVYAFLQAKPRRPTFVFGLDSEEIGSKGPSGGVYGFFQRVISNFLSTRMGLRRALTFEELYNQEVLGLVPAICADVSPVPSRNEMKMDHISILEAAKYGFGPFVAPSWGYEANAVTPHDVRYVQQVLRHAFPSKNGTAKWQMVGSEFNSDEAARTGGTHFACYFTDRHVPMVAMGVPVGDLHRPGGELMFYADFYLTMLAYKSYMEFSPPKRLLRPDG